MSVKTSTLDGHSPLWIPPVSDPMTYASQTQPADSGSWYEVGNDAGDAQANGVSVVTASAESLNTAYTDLYHRVAGTDGENMIQMAQAFGVNTDRLAGCTPSGTRSAPRSARRPSRSRSRPARSPRWPTAATT